MGRCLAWQPPHQRLSSDGGFKSNRGLGKATSFFFDEHIHTHQTPCFERFDGMADFSDTILLFDPESEFLQKTKNRSKYSTLWFPINQKRFCRNGLRQDISISFIGGTHNIAGQDNLPFENPLHQYVYRNNYLQKLISMGCPVFRAAGAQTDIL
jgi:hypothetical protein